MYIIFSGNHAESLACMAQFNLTPENSRYLSSRFLLDGLKNFHVLYYGTYRQRADYPDVIDYLRSANLRDPFKTVLVNEGLKTLPPLKEETVSEDMEITTISALHQTLRNLASKQKHPLDGFHDDLAI